MSRRVDVYEVSRKVTTTELDFVEFHQLRYKLARETGFQEVLAPNSPAFRDEMPVYVKHSESVGMLRTEDGATKYLAVSPELRELLEVHVKDTQTRRLEGQIASLEAALLAERKSFRVLELCLVRCESDLRVESARQRNFLEANVITRVWRAIWGRL